MSISLEGHNSKLARAALAHWLHNDRLAAVALEPVRGGLSGAEVWRVGCGDKNYCLRRWPPLQSDVVRVQQVHTYQLQAVNQGCSFVPDLIPTPGETRLVLQDNCVWELATWMRGIPNYTKSPSEKKRSAAMLTLAQLHTATATLPLPSTMAAVGLSPGLAERVERIRKLQNGELAELARRVTFSSDRRSIADIARQLLTQLHNCVPAVGKRLARVADCRFPLGWCLRDIHAGNLLFEGESLSGLVDFGAVAVDSVAIDLARLIRSLAEGESALWLDCLKVYHDARPLTRMEIESICAFDQSGTVGAAANWLRWIFVEGRSVAGVDSVVERMRLIAGRLQALDAAAELASGFP